MEQITKPVEGQHDGQVTVAPRSGLRPHRRPPRHPHPPHLTHHPQIKDTPRLTPHPTQSKIPQNRAKNTPIPCYNTPQQNHPPHHSTTHHPRTKPMTKRQKRRNHPTQPDPTAMTLPPVTAVDDHRRAPARTVTRPPSPKNRCKIVTKSGLKKLSPAFTRLFRHSRFSRHIPANHIPPFHHPYNSCPSLISPRMPAKPGPYSPEKNRFDPPKHSQTLPNPPKHSRTLPAPTRPPAPQICAQSAPIV